MTRLIVVAALLPAGLLVQGCAALSPGEAWRMVQDGGQRVVEGGTKIVEGSSEAGGGLVMVVEAVGGLLTWVIEESPLGNLLNPLAELLSGAVSRVAGAMGEAATNATEGPAMRPPGGDG